MKTQILSPIFRLLLLWVKQSVNVLNAFQSHINVLRWFLRRADLWVGWLKNHVVHKKRFEFFFTIFLNEDKYLCANSVFSSHFLVSLLLEILNHWYILKYFLGWEVFGNIGGYTGECLGLVWFVPNLALPMHGRAKKLARVSSAHVSPIVGANIHVKVNWRGRLARACQLFGSIPNSYHAFGQGQ